MISELKDFFNKEFCYQITICSCCKKETHLMVDGSIDMICHVVCNDCIKEPIFNPISK